MLLVLLALLQHADLAVEVAHRVLALLFAKVSLLAARPAPPQSFLVVLLLPVLLAVLLLLLLSGLVLLSVRVARWHLCGHWLRLLLGSCPAAAA